MMWTPRTTPLEYGEQPWRWDVPSVYQCTWFVYYESIRQLGATPPTFWDRATKTGSYPNAKEWLKNFREPWEVKGKDYTPVAGDIVVYDGEYGHVQFMETDTMYSEYSSGDPHSFRNGKFARKDNLLGFLHYPYNAVEPVERNENVDQIECTDDTLRIRTEPSLNGEIVGHVQIGYYNVLNETEADNYTWYEIGKDRWCADITTKYLPKGDSDFVEEIRKWADNMVTTIKMKDEKIADMTKDMKTISDISRKWE